MHTTTHAYIHVRAPTHTRTHSHTQHTKFIYPSPCVCEVEQRRAKRGKEASFSRSGLVKRSGEQTSRILESHIVNMVWVILVESKAALLCVWFLATQ